MLEAPRRHHDAAPFGAPVDHHPYDLVALDHELGGAPPGADLDAGVDERAEQTAHQGPAPDVAAQDHPVVGGSIGVGDGRRGLVEGGLDAALDIRGQAYRPGPQ